MSAISYARGWELIFFEGEWLYKDNKSKYDDSRPCNKCGKARTKEGYDDCIGYVKGVSFACCGHGKEEPYFKEL